MTTGLVDAAVIGGGVIGCSTALHLARGGMRVALLERRGLCCEASGVNAGTLTMHMVRITLIPYALRGWEMWRTAPRWLGADVGVRVKDGLSLACSPAEAEVLRMRAEGRKAAGAPIEIIDARRAREIEPALSAHPLLAAYCRVDGDAVSSLAGGAFRAALLAEGVEVRERMAVAGIEREGAAFVVGAGAERVNARRVVLAGGVWLQGMLRWFGLDVPIKCVTNQVSVTERLPPVFKTVIGVASGSLSLKQLANGTVLIGGGWRGIGDRERGGFEVVPASLIGNLRLARYVVPALARARVARTWLGLESESADALPLLGPVPGVDGAFVVGCAPSGFTSGPYLGRLMAEFILGREPELPLFDPARLVAAAAAPRRA